MRLFSKASITTSYPRRRVSRIAPKSIILLDSRLRANDVKKTFLRRACSSIFRLMILALFLFSANTLLANSFEKEQSITIDQLLLKISQAEKTVSYSGVQEKTLMHAGKPMQFQWRISHWPAGKTYLEFTSPESVAGSAFLQDGDSRRYRGESHIGDGLLRRGFASLLQNGQLLKELKLLQENYEIDVRGNETFLERAVYRLSISPRRQNRPAFSAIVDQETGLLLQSRRTPPASAVDTTSKMTRFVEVNFETPDSTQLDLNFPEPRRESRGRRGKRTQASVYTDVSTMMNVHKRSFLVPQSTPEGFALQRIRVFEKGRHTFVHFLYSDGLTMISLFQRENGDHRGRRGGGERTKKSDRRDPFQVVRGKSGKIHYSVVGEISRDELQKMADNLLLINPGQSFSQVTLYSGAALAALLLLFIAYRLYRRSTETSDV